MIVDILLYIVYGVVVVLTSPFRLFANVSLSSELTNAIYIAGSYLKALDTFLPITMLLSVFGIMVGYEVIILLYKIIMWILRKIPGIN